MRAVNFVATALMIIPALCARGQNEPVKTVEVAKRFNIVTIPADAQLIGFDDKGIEQVQPNPSPQFEPGKGEVYTFEARRPGYMSVKRKYSREKGGVESDTIILTTRIVKLTASPAGAELFVNNTSVGKGAAELAIPLNKNYKVDARCPGYVPASTVFYNQEGKPEPGEEYNFNLEDRLVKMKATPAGAAIYADGIKAGQDSADVMIKGGSCVNIYAKLAGYETKSVNYCNKFGGGEIPLNNELHLSGRLATISTDPDYASISVDGRDAAIGTYDLKIPEGKCLVVQAKADGYVPAVETICNKAGSAPARETYTLKLAADEVIKQTEESSKANTEFTLDVNPDIKTDEAWKKLCSILQEYHFDLETHDDAVNFLRTRWNTSQPINAGTAFPRIIRTRVDVKGGSKKPLTYIIQVKNEISNMSEDCVGDVQKYQQISNDACFEPYSRLLKKYADLISDLQGRVGYTPVAAGEGAGSDALRSQVGVTDYGEPDGKPNPAEGDHFIAVWHCVNAEDTIAITKNGSNYQLERKGKKIKMYSRQDYLVNKDPAIGKITWSDNHVLFQGKEYEDVTAASLPK